MKRFLLKTLSGSITSFVTLCISGEGNVCITVQSCQLTEFEKQQGGRVVGVEVVNIGQSTCPVKFIKVLKSSNMGHCCFQQDFWQPSDSVILLHTKKKKNLFFPQWGSVINDSRLADGLGS